MKHVIVSKEPTGAILEHNSYVSDNGSLRWEVRAAGTRCWRPLASLSREGAASVGTGLGDILRVGRKGRVFEVAARGETPACEHPKGRRSHIMFGGGSATPIERCRDCSALLYKDIWHTPEPTNEKSDGGGEED